MEILSVSVYLSASLAILLLIFVLVLLLTSKEKFRSNTSGCPSENVVIQTVTVATNQASDPGVQISNPTSSPPAQETKKSSATSTNSSTPSSPAPTSSQQPPAISSTMSPPAATTSSQQPPTVSSKQPSAAGSTNKYAPVATYVCAPNYTFDKTSNLCVTTTAGTKSGYSLTHCDSDYVFDPNNNKCQSKSDSSTKASNAVTYVCPKQNPAITDFTGDLSYAYDTTKKVCIFQPGMGVQRAPVYAKGKNPSCKSGYIDNSTISTNQIYCVPGPILPISNPTPQCPKGYFFDSDTLKCMFQCGATSGDTSKVLDSDYTGCYPRCDTLCTKMFDLPGSSMDGQLIYTTQLKENTNRCSKPVKNLFNTDKSAKLEDINTCIEPIKGKAIPTYGYSLETKTEMGGYNKKIQEYYDTCVVSNISDSCVYNGANKYIADNPAQFR